MPADPSVPATFLPKDLGNVLKGIAIGLVLLGHAAGRGGLAGLSMLGPIGISIFLVMSGYGVNESMRSAGPRGYFVKRVRKILVPYWTTLAIALLAQTMFGIGGNRVQAPHFLLVGFPYGYFWFIPFLFSWYLVYYLLRQYAGRCFHLLLFGWSMVIFAGSRSLLESQAAFSFLLGVLCSDYSRQAARFLAGHRQRLLSLSACLVIAAGGFAAKQTPLVKAAARLVGARSEHESRTLWQVLAAGGIQLTVIIPATVAIILLCVHARGREMRLCGMLGKSSYEIYLLHTFTVFLIDRQNLWYMAPPTLMATLAGGIALNRLLGRVGLGR